MIKEKDIAEFRPQVRFQDGASITLDTIKNALSDCAKQHGVPMAFENDQVKFGGLIGGSTFDALVIYHPDHKKDYYNFGVIVKKQGGYAFVSSFGTGSSKQVGKSLNASQAGAEAKSAMKNLFDPNVDAGTALGGLVGAGIKKAFSLGRSNQKLEEEQNWYAMVGDIYDEVIS